MQPERDTNERQQPVQPSNTPNSVSPDGSSMQAPIVSLNPNGPALQETAQTLSQETKASSANSKEEVLHWQANEYVHHEKNTLWFVLFGLVAAVLMIIAIFLVHSVTFTILVPVMVAALLVYTYRPPRLIDYTLSQQGLHINDHLYPFAEFKAFGVIHDGKEYSVMLIPVKRFRPGVSVYFPEASGEAIVDILGARLPMQELHLDLVDNIIHKLRI